MFHRQYIFSPEGKLYCDFPIPYIYDYFHFYYSIIPYSHVDDTYNYYLIHKANSYNYYFRKYTYYLCNNSISEQMNYLYKTNKTTDSINSITCQLMKYNSNNVITCFFANNNYINCTVFDSENNFAIINTSSIIKNSKDENYLKSAVMTIDGRQKAIVCATDNDEVFLCVGYDIKSNILSEIIKIKNYNLFYYY